MSNCSSFAPPVEFNVLGSVTTPPGASPLAGHPDCFPVTMSGDAWESAAYHFISLRNAGAWRQIAEFLDALPRRPEPCLFPQPEFVPVKALAITGFYRWPSCLRVDFIDPGFFGGQIDAPDSLPQGSHDSMRFGNSISAFATVQRSRL